MRHILAAITVLLLGIAGCAEGGGDTAGPDIDADGTTSAPTPQTAEADLLMVAKVAPLADLARQVAGDRAEVVSLIPEGADSHTFEPRPGDARTLGQADVFIGNGLDLNDALMRLAEANVPDGAPIVRVAEETAGQDELIYDHVHDHDDDHHHDDEGHTHDDADHGDDGHTHDETDDGAGPNPHLWMSVDHAIGHVEVIARVLAEVDPDHADEYEANATSYIAQLEALDAAIFEAIDSIPADQRRLVTFHDSWSYFGPRYGIEVIAVVQPADFSEPSAGEVARIIDEIRAHDVPAVFGSEVFPSDVLAVIAEETDATYVGDVSDDSLPGEAGDPEHSYIGLMARNVRLVVDGLGGDTSPLDAVDPAVR